MVVPNGPFKRPHQEKMALFWHNHFATAYSKIAGIVGGVQATRMMALKADELPGPQGQIELFGRWRLAASRLIDRGRQDPAMLVWLDGRLNTRQRPERTSAARSWSSSRLGSVITTSSTSTLPRASSLDGISAW